MGNMSGSYGSHYTLWQSITQNWQSVAENYTNITVRMYLSFDGSSYYAYTNSTTYGNMGDLGSYSIGSLSYSSGQSKDILLAEWTGNVYHDSDGTKYFGVSGYWDTSTSRIGSGSCSAGVWLSQIPRYTTITQFDTAPVSETEIKFTWAASDNVDWLSYSLNGGNWVDSGGNPVTISSLSANTQYSLKIRVRRTDSGLWTESGTNYVTTYDYPKPTSTNDFTIGDGATVNLYNPLGRNCTLQIIGNNNAVLGTYTGTYTGNVNAEFKTAEAIAAQYASIPSATQATYYAKVTYGSVVKTYSNGNIYKIKSTEVPTFSNFTYADTNSTTTALTGNNQILVNGYSNVTGTISTANKATANNSATMSHYKMVIGTKSSASITYSSSASVSGTINNANSSSIIMHAVDSRGLSTAVTKTATIKNYTDLIISSFTATRSSNGVGQAVTLAFNGTFWGNSFGSVTNTITSVTYKYKETSASSWTTGTTSLSATISGSNYSGSFSVVGDLGADGFDISKAFNIMITVQDKLSTKTYTVTLGSGAPAIAIYKNSVAIGQKYDTSDGSKLQVNGRINATAIKSKLESINGRITDANITHTYENNKAHIQLLQSTSTMTSNKPSGDGYIVHYSWDNSSPYNFQIFNPVHPNSVMQARICENNTWGSWEDIFRAKTLYYNSSGTTGTITLSESTANFTYIEIFYARSNEGYASQKIFSPNGKQANLAIITGNVAKYITMYGTTISISGTSISFVAGKGLSVASANPDAALYCGGWSEVNEILVYKVLGYR